MARTESKMLPLGTKAPNFKLIDTIDNKLKTLQELKGIKGTLIMFICNHCPFVIHVNAQLAQLAKDFVSRGINCIAISSNDVENYPQDAPDLMKQNALDNGFIFPYLYDQTQEVAKAYDAACTPDFYVFDKALKTSVYRTIRRFSPWKQYSCNGKRLKNCYDSSYRKRKNRSKSKTEYGL